MCGPWGRGEVCWDAALPKWVGRGGKGCREATPAEDMLENVPLGRCRAVELCGELLAEGLPVRALLGCETGNTAVLDFNNILPGASINERSFGCCGNFLGWGAKQNVLPGELERGQETGRPRGLG